MLQRVVILVTCLSGAPAVACSAPPQAELEIHLAAVNAERTRAGRAALRLSPELARVAQAHACDMTQRRFFSHTSPDGRDMMRRTRSAGLSEICAIGENIAQGQPDVPTVVAGWMRSPGHRRNILDSDFRFVGFGRAPGPNWVQLFAAPC